MGHTKKRNESCKPRLASWVSFSPLRSGPRNGPHWYCCGCCCLRCRCCRWKSTNCCGCLSWPTRTPNASPVLFYIPRREALSHQSAKPKRWTTETPNRNLKLAARKLVARELPWEISSNTPVVHYRRQNSVIRTQTNIILLKRLNQHFYLSSLTRLAIFYFVQKFQIKSPIPLEIHPDW